MNIPDLQDTPEITLEHCSVLLERLGQALDTADDQSGFKLTNSVDPEMLLEHFERWFDPDSFTNLFRTELGKGVLVGSFVQKLLDEWNGEEC